MIGIEEKTRVEELPVEKSFSSSRRIAERWDFDAAVRGN